MEKRHSFQVLSIEGWRCPEGWTWNQWYKRGRVELTDSELDSSRKLLRILRERGILSWYSAGKVAIDDDGYNKVVVVRSTREPLYAVEYVSDYA